MYLVMEGGIVKKIYVKFDDRNTDLNRIDSDKFARETDAVQCNSLLKSEQSVFPCN